MLLYVCGKVNMAQTERRRSKEEMYSIIEHWQSSGLTKQAFCGQESISKPVFYYWHKKYKSDQEPGGFYQSKSAMTAPCQVRALRSNIQTGCSPFAKSYTFGNHQGIPAPVAMFSLTTSHEFLLYRKVTDFHKGFDGLCGLVRNELDRDPSSGEVFVFVNRPRNRIKLLQWQHGGFVLYYKRLEKGTISIPALNSGATSCTLSFSDLVMMIEGISLERVVRKPRYQGS